MVKKANHQGLSPTITSFPAFVYHTILCKSTMMLNFKLFPFHYIQYAHCAVCSKLYMNTVKPLVSLSINEDTGGRFREHDLTSFIISSCLLGSFQHLIQGNTYTHTSSACFMCSLIFLSSFNKHQAKITTLIVHSCMLIPGITQSMLLLLPKMLFDHISATI